MEPRITLLPAKIILLLLTTVVFYNSLNAQVKKVMPIDTIQNTLDKLKAELNAKYLLYNPKYKTPGVVLKVLTFYEYNAGNELINDKSIAEDESYTLNMYQNKNIIETVGTLSGHKKIVLKKYNSEGKMEEKKEYSDYFPEYEDKETYKIESVTSKAKDTVKTRSYINGNPERKFVFIYDTAKLLKELLAYNTNDLRPDSKYTYYYMPDKKHIEKELFHDYRYKLEIEKLNLYNKDGLLERYVEKNLNDGKKKESLYYYNEKKLMIKQEDFTPADSLPATVHHKEYDVGDHLISEKTYTGKGEMIYQCLYEYDDKGNKISYLYFFRGR